MPQSAVHPESPVRSQGSDPPCSRVDAASLARLLGVSVEAVELCRRCDLIDLHLDPFIANRLWGYDFLKRHSRGPFGRWLFGHMDVPRALDAGLSGAMFSITTNPLRSPRNRWITLQKNIARMRAIISSSQGTLALVRSWSEYNDVRNSRNAKNTRPIACLLAIQGGNALIGAPNGIASVEDNCICRVTLVHLTSSGYGCTSSPASMVHRDRGLTRRGVELVKQLNHARCFVDLAHIHPKGFWQALEHHDRALPAIVTHTGVSGVTPHWRNLSDAQIQAIAHTGGTIGVLFHTAFVDTAARAYVHRTVSVRNVLAHAKHIIDVAGEDFVSIGSDFDGFIVPPHDLADVTAYPRFVQLMLDTRWSHERIEKILGGNFLRVFKMMRP